MMTVQQAFDLALQHHQAGRLTEAEALYRQILAVEPRRPEALHLLGVIAQQVGRNDLAVELIGQAIALQPNSPEAHSNLGMALRNEGRLDEAIASCRQAILLKPNYFEALNNLGNALRDRGQLDEAIASHRQAIAIRPGYPEAHFNLGNALSGSGQLDEAIASYRQAILLKPDYPEALNNLGNVLRDRERLDEAIASYRQAILLKPDYPEAHNNLGNALRDTGQLDEATASFRQAIDLQPDYPEAHSNLGNILKDEGQLDEAIAAYRQAMAFRPEFPDAHSNLLLALNYHPGLDPSAVYEEHRRWNRQHAEPLRPFIQPHGNDPTPDRRLRIGYVSPDFCDHPVGHFLLPLLAHHDHEHFEIFCYAQVPAPDGMTRQLRAHADHWHSLTGLPDAQAADLIRHHQIDILVDLSGHTSHNRLLLFAHQPAPVQVTFLGYPNTTGLATMDYRLTDACADPPGLTESFHSEQLVRLPRCGWCYQPSDSPTVAIRNEGPITFGSFNNFAKITEPALLLWARILHAMPGSRLLLKTYALGSENARQRVRQILGEAGITAERLELRGYEPAHDDHRALYQRVDVALDTFPYNGTTTTCEALWMGVPVVTLAGKTHASRVGVSLLTNIDLPNLVADTAEDYVRLAADLAGDVPLLSHLRGTLRQRMEQSPLMDAPRFARDIEAAYRAMWRQWCAKETGP